MKYIYSLFFLLLIAYLGSISSHNKEIIVTKKSSQNYKKKSQEKNNPLFAENKDSKQQINIHKKELPIIDSNSIYENIKDHNHNDDSNLNSVVLTITDSDNIDLKFVYKNEEYIHRGEINDHMVFETPESGIFFGSLEKFNQAYIFKIFPQNIANDVNNEIAIMVKQEFAEDINSVTEDFNTNDSLSQTEQDQLLDFKRVKIRHAMADLMFEPLTQKLNAGSTNE